MVGWLKRYRAKITRNRAFFVVEEALRQADPTAARSLFETALEMLRKALHLNPYDANAHNESAFIFIRMNDLDQAKISAEKAVQYDPANPKFRNTLIGVQLETVQKLRDRESVSTAVQELMPEIDRLVTEHPDYPPGYFSRAEALAMAGAAREDWDRELDNAAKAYRRNVSMGSGMRANESTIANTLSRKTDDCLRWQKWWSTLDKTFLGIGCANWV